MISDENSQAIALQLGDSFLRFGELRKMVEDQKHSVKTPPRRVVALEADFSFEFICVFLALFESGQPIALLSPSWKTAEKANRISLLASSCGLDVRTGEFTWQSDSEHSEIDPRCALILFTSGSSGAPKAVQLSRANIEANIQAVIPSLEFASTTEQTLFLPLSYSFGLSGQLLPALRCCVSTRLVPEFHQLKNIIDQGMARGMWSGVPSHWEALLRITEDNEQALANITHVISAGAPMSADLKRNLHSRFKNATIYNNYGQTEASPRILCLSSKNPNFFKNCVGLPVGDWQCKIAEDGELLVSGTQVMLGYLGDKEGTNQKLKNNWLCTGDSATQDSDGIISIHGRRDEIFNIGGERTSPVEIETALKKLPGIHDAAILIEDHPIYGAKITAFLVSAVSFSLKEALPQLSQALSPSKIPKEFYRVKEVPRQPNGKTARTLLAQEKNPKQRLSS